MRRRRSGLFDFLFPQPKLYKPLKHISSEWRYEGITDEQQILMEAGMARDPQHAQSVIEELREQYGERWLRKVDLTLARKQQDTFKVRVMKLFRRIFGELERPKPLYKKREAVVDVNIRFRDDD